jgi:hypothetical protein
MSLAKGDSIEAEKCARSAETILAERLDAMQLAAAAEEPCSESTAGYAWSINRFREP